MPVTLMCPSLKCRAVLQVSDKMRGKKVRCGQCGTAFMVPNKKGGAAAPSSSARATPE